jgi:hypothetical protein
MRRDRDRSRAYTAFEQVAAVLALRRRSTHRRAHQHVHRAHGALVFIGYM